MMRKKYSVLASLTFAWVLFSCGDSQSDQNPNKNVSTKPIAFNATQEGMLKEELEGMPKKLMERAPIGSDGKPDYPNSEVREIDVELTGNETLAELDEIWNRAKPIAKNDPVHTSVEAFGQSYNYSGGGSSQPYNLTPTHSTAPAGYPSSQIPGSNNQDMTASIGGGMGNPIAQQQGAPFSNNNQVVVNNTIPQGNNWNQGNQFGGGAIWNSGVGHWNSGGGQWRSPHWNGDSGWGIGAGLGSSCIGVSWTPLCGSIFPSRWAPVGFAWIPATVVSFQTVCFRVLTRPNPCFSSFGCNTPWFG